MTVSVKSLQKQLIAAVAMVLVAMIALGSSTYAWFASNNSVTAQSMSVSAKSDALFLEIRTGAGTFNGSTIAINATNAGSTAPENGLLPITPVFSDSTLSTWKYSYSNSVSSSTSNGNWTNVATNAPNIGNYVLINEFALRTTVEGTSIANIVATEVSATTDAAENSIDEAVRVLIVGPNGYQIWDAGTKTFTTPASESNKLFSSVTYDANTSGGQSVKVYVYYDGEDEKLYTNNLTTLAGMQVSVTFGPLVP